MNTIYFIRHGITEGNKKRLYYGSTDLPLIEEGIEAIRKRKKAGIYPASKGFTFVTSALKRTEQTLFEIYGEVQHISDARLNEIDFGDFEMKSYEELKYVSEYQEWISGDNWKNICPNGESGEKMLQRVASAMQEYNNQDYIIVCHGGIIASLMDGYFPHCKANFYEWQPKPCEGYRVDFDNGEPISYSEVKIDDN